ncbi:MAG: hypothetical protein KatS3mg110_3647 [Pirellulaceae bacterium]|nr:MAG: hypothetical protein KatS3mg110_3647 [Pirellulaceae bacterium]
MIRSGIAVSRRDFLRSGLAGSALLALNGQVPAFLRQAAADAANRSDHILVVLQLSGGNDGLNTVVPYRDPLYYAHRPELGIPAGDVLKINDEVGFHAAMRGAAELLEAGKLAIVQGVGYPQPNRSHFESMDIWHTCFRKTQPRRDGWLGRYLERVPQPSELPALHIGDEQQPLALASQEVRVPSVASFEEFRLQAEPAVRRKLEALVARNAEQNDGLLDFVRSSTQAALRASQQLADIAKSRNTAGGYPRTPLGERLATIAQLIGADLPTRIYYLALDGFDTHAQQPAAHAALLEQWSMAVKAFFDELEQQGNAARVLLFSFSEFGRRVQENASQGTDHGAAAPVFLAGPGVRPGVHGALPSLEDLDDGDLKFHTDFRRVYAALLEDWLGLADSAPVLAGKYDPVPVLKKAT